MRGKKSAEKSEGRFRVFYCNIHGRITEEDYEAEVESLPTDIIDCRYCDDWYHSIRRTRVKWWNES